MEMFIGVAIVAYAIKALISDVTYAIKGKLSPRAELRAMQIKAAAEAGQPIPPTGLGYVAELVRHAWTAMAEKRAKRRRASWSERKGMRGYLGRRWELAWERAWHKHLRRLETKDLRRDLGASRSPYRRPSFGLRMGRMLGELAAVAALTWKRIRARLTRKRHTAATPEPAWAEPAPVFPLPVRPHLTVVPPDSPTITPDAKINTHPEGITMTASTSEIVTLDDAIAWTNNTAGTAKNSVISVESAMADLRSQGVGEAALSGLGRMQELFNMIAAEAAAVNAEFRSHTGVKEAYLAAQDAGTKEHLLGG